MFSLKKILGITCGVALLAAAQAGAQAPAAPDKIPEPVPVEKPQPEKDKLPSFGIDYENLSRRGSLMFSKRDLQRVYSAIRGNLVNNDQLGGTQPTDQTPKVAPAFYLNSVVFIADKNWAIWVNGKKIRVQDVNPILKVEYVSRDKVEISWETKDLDIISPGWRTKFELGQPDGKNGLKQAGYYSKKYNVSVSLDGALVRFALMPNQTFVSKDMKIMEGFVAETPITVPTSEDGFTVQQNNSTPSPTSATAPATPAPAANGAQQIKIN